jgi:cobalt/nickel transport system permease protein
MSKINQAVREIGKLDELAAEDRWVNQIHPLVKLFLTIFYIGLVVSFSGYDLAGTATMAVYPVVIFIVGEIPFWDALRRLRIVLPLVCVVGVFNPIFDRAIVSYMGNIAVSGGVLSMCTLMGKGILSVLASYLLIASTSIEKICYALRLLHVPKILVTQVLLTYRYVSLLLLEASRLTRAYALRAPGQKGIHFKAWGSLVGGLLLRSMDRAETVYESMCIRGYHGEFYYRKSIKFRRQDLAYLLGWTIVFLILRYLPVPEILGRIFVQ